MSKWAVFAVLSLVPACGATADPTAIDGLLDGVGGDPGIAGWPGGGGVVVPANGGAPGTGGYGAGGATPPGTGGGTGGAGTGGLGSGGQAAGGSGSGGTGSAGSGSGGAGSGGLGAAGAACLFPFPCPTGGGGGVGMGGTAGAAGAGTGAMSGFKPDATNPKECPTAAPENPWGPCAGLPIYLNCKYSDGTRPYACVCDWIHWICI